MAKVVFIWWDSVVVYITLASTTFKAARYTRLGWLLHKLVVILVIQDEDERTIVL
jgi:hypothetical protein